jgi:CDP-diglyceride synthetase
MKGKRMIGRPDWFAKRNFGIGIRPKTWQGWIYVLVAIALIVFIVWQPFWDWSNQTRNILIIAFVVTLVLDAIHIMNLLNKNKKGNG